MPKKPTPSWEYSYLTLPAHFYAAAMPFSFPAPQLVLQNNTLFQALNLPQVNAEDVTAFFLNPPVQQKGHPFAQAYAGHQFGGFTKLGDGRAIVLGEQVAANGQRFDIQLKGAGKTMYSRGGDGKATLKSMLREYLISEAMQALNIPTSRSLAVMSTGELVPREKMHLGAVLVRVMKSHIRVGTFEYARHFGTTADLNALADYTINRLYPHISQHENTRLSLLTTVMNAQIDLVVNWMRVGFIHGVMNTDNVAISAETFDYGPCAFMNAYHPHTVFSSIDTQGRYAFGNQPKIAKWNVARFAEALLPILHTNPQQALLLAQQTIDGFDALWKEKYNAMMLRKLGIQNGEDSQVSLAHSLLHLMQKHQMDYTNTFLALTKNTLSNVEPTNSPEFKAWHSDYKGVIDATVGAEQAALVMAQTNPAIIPRNHVVEEALDAAADGNLGLLNKLLELLKTPYNHHDSLTYCGAPPSASFEAEYATFCGT
ncbi:MAG: YdiU family protein [Bacteroidetes bacterium]|nr:MAG: YdiU family protein [Bacteroidota bacterium]